MSSGWMISIDANTKRTGVAFWNNGELFVVATLTSKQKSAMLAGAEMSQKLKEVMFRGTRQSLEPIRRCVVEWPASYGSRGRGSKVAPRTVQALTVVATSLTSAVVATGDVEVRQVKPSVWKGSAKKFTRNEDGTWNYLMWPRIKAALSERELAFLAPFVAPHAGGLSVVRAKSGWDDDVLDSVGLGLFDLRRL